MVTDSSRISPTAHYTAYVWYRHAMSHEALRTPTGWLLFHALQPPLQVYRRLRAGPTLEAMLLRRHRVIDHLLAEAIEAGAVGQVVEIACGLSPRGFRFMERYRDRGLRYVEGDLPDMAARKRRLLDGAGLRGPDHHVVTLDALRDDGPDSLAAIAAEHLDPTLGTAVITEGLVNYFDEVRVRGIWRRVARALRAQAGGVYLTDLHLEEETRRYRAARAFEHALGVFARGAVHIHFADADAAGAALREAGFDTVAVHRPGDFADEGVPLPELPRGDVNRVAAATVEAGA